MMLIIRDPRQSDAEGDDQEGHLKEDSDDVGVFEKIGPLLEIDCQEEHSVEGDGRVGRGKRLDRVLQSLVPDPVEHVQRICASEGGFVVAVDDDVVVPRLLELQAGLHFSVEEELGLAKLQEVRTKSADDVFTDFGGQLLEDEARDERA